MIKKINPDHPLPHQTKKIRWSGNSRSEDQRTTDAGVTPTIISSCGPGEQKAVRNNLQRIFHRLATLTLAVLLFGSCRQVPEEKFLDRPPSEDEIDYRPADGEVQVVNPPAFIWLPAEGAESYTLQYAPSADFDPDETVTIEDLTMTVHIPTTTMAPGTWHWRYGVSGGREAHYSRSRSFTIPGDAVAFPFIPIDEVLRRIPAERPRLHFTPALVTEIRADREGRYAAITDGVIRQAEEILEREEPLFEEPRPWEESDDPRMAYVKAWSAMRPYTQRMVTSALAYIYTGDERFALEAKRRLMHFMTWDVEGPSRAIFPTELGMDIAENAPPVFDWIYPVLSEEERKKCLEVLAARMHQISYFVHRNRPMETSPFSSHPGRMVGFVVEGSIALAHDVPAVADWLDYTLKLLWSTYPAWSKTDGGWNEGISYWGSYMRRMIRVVAQLDRFGIPLKEKPFFRNTGNFGLYAAYPYRPTKAFGDGLSEPLGSGHGQLMYNLSALYKNPYYRWHANVSEVNSASGRDAFLFTDSSVVAKKPEDIPQSALFKDVGLVTMHSHMADPAENVLMLFQSNPFGAQSHNHACQNAFVIEAYGEPLAISTGSRQVHGSDHHREWMWNTKAHNSMLVDHEGQTTRSRESKGEIIYYRDLGDCVATTGDATQAYGGRLERFHRHVLFIRPNYFVIIDDLKTAGKESTFQWLLHSPTEIRADRQALITENRSGNVRLTTRFLMPDEITFSQHTGFTPQAHDSTRFHNQYHLTASTTSPAQSQRFVTVLCVDRTKQTPPERPQRPSTPRREVEIREIERIESLDKALMNARFVDAEGGLAIRLGNDLILWKEHGSERVSAGGISTTEPMELKRDCFNR